MMHPEGQYDFGSDQYHFNLTDHLGNVRAVVNEAGTVLQREDYYPFGLTFNSSGNVSDYKYNGKEEQEETGWLDYHARQYDPALGRMLSIDPLADMMTSHNPYHYTYNNPLNFTDPTGMAPESFQDLLGDLWEQAGENGKATWTNPDSDESDDESSGCGGPENPCPQESTKEPKSGKQQYFHNLEQKAAKTAEKVAAYGNLAIDVAELGQKFGAKYVIPKKLGLGFTIIQIGSKFYQGDNKGGWIEVGKSVVAGILGRYGGGGFINSGAELFYNIGKHQANQIYRDQNKEALFWAYRAAKAEEDVFFGLAKEYNERAISIQNKAKRGAENILY
ncbi:RHS repeat domain-containing protein [Marivirga sp.]|uniref:RHS repeat domain-containing protein n=1 Tax=Marivirga sp. TaxID=2018662 RepID=UPI003DA6EF7A